MQSIEDIKAEAARLEASIISATSRANRQIEVALKSGNLEQALGLWFALKEGNKDLDDARKKMGATVEKYGKSIFPAEFERRGFDLFRSPTLKRSFSMRTEYTSRMVDKDKGFAWLRENGGEDLIQPSVNAGTLKSFMRAKLEEEGVEAPDDTIVLNSFSAIGSNKYTPKEAK